MSLPLPHPVCRLMAACLMLACLAGRTPGKVCCGEATPQMDRVAAASAQVQKAPAPGGACRHCSKHDAPSLSPVTTAQSHSCPTDAADCDGGGSDDKQPCHRGACTAVCCHVSAVTTAPPAVATAGEVPHPFAVADQQVPARADGDAIFHPPRA